MGQTVGTISKIDPLSYCWNLGTNRSPASVWRSPNFTDFSFSNDALFLRFNHGTLSLCHHTSAASFSFNGNIVLKYSTKTENFKLNNVRKCKQYWDENTDEYILKTIDIKSLESICCTFTNVRGICETAIEKDEQNTKSNFHAVGEKSEVRRVRIRRSEKPRGEQETKSNSHAGEEKSEGRTLIIRRSGKPRGEQETNVEPRVAETKSQTREASVQCAISEYAETRGEQETNVEPRVAETKSQTKEASVQCEISEYAETRGLVSLGTDLRELFVSDEDSDVTFQVGDQKYPVHKIILRARSPVFRAMLKRDMTEKSEEVVDIPDCDRCAFRDLLLYLYAGKLDNISEENVFELYRMSDKYDVKQLKMDCVDFMLGNLTVEIIGDVISLAFKHSEAQLLSRATEFFVKNAKSVLPTVNWQKFVQENPIEANKLFIRAFK